MSEYEDRFRWCIYCRADCWVDEPDHAAECPSSTGVFPVREEDVLCPGCKQTHIGMCCTECGHDFRVGDHYTHSTIEEGDPLLPGIEGAAVHAVVCLGCAAREEVLDA